MKIVFSFPGQGSQIHGMLKDLPDYVKIVTSRTETTLGVMRMAMEMQPHHLIEISDLLQLKWNEVKEWVVSSLRENLFVAFGAQNKQIRIISLLEFAELNGISGKLQKS